MSLESIWQDLRYGVRQLAKAPVLITVAILSLGLGIGANTAIFTLIDAVMFQALPVQDPARLVLFNDDIATGVYSGESFASDEFSYPSFQYLQAHNDSFESLCAFRQGRDRVTMHMADSRQDVPVERARIHLVSGNFFETLGVRAALGRVMTAADDTPTAARVAVMSYSFWRERFRGDRAVVGQSVVLNGTAFTIAGVADAGFFGERIEGAPNFWLPLSAQPQVLPRDDWSNSRAQWLEARDVFWLNFFGRLKPGVTLAAAEASVNLHLRQFYAEHAGANPSEGVRRSLQAVHVVLKPGGSGISGLRFRYGKPLRVLMAVVGLVLLIACANVATLLLARASARRQEFLARLALGASRARLVRQVLTESVLLSLLGGAVGLVFAWWCVRLLTRLLDVNAVVRVEPDAAVLALTAAISVISGLLFGLFPALRFSRLDLRPAASATAPARLGTLRLSGQHGLILLQVALSLVLLVGAGMLVRSLLALEGQNVGFRPDHVLVVETDARLAGYQAAQLFPIYRDLGERLNHLPGVLSASIARFTPISGSLSRYTLAIEGRAVSSTKEMNICDLSVAPRFFETLGMPLLRGRAIDERDTPDSTLVVVVNETFVRKYFPTVNPIDQRISLGSRYREPGFEIVGVVGDAKYYDLREQAQPMGFFAIAQKPVVGFDMIVHVAGRAAGTASEVQRAISQVNNKLPILKVKNLDDQVEGSFTDQKMVAELSSAFGALALLLAAIGIYGTLAYSVAGRVKEIGIRMAIGAQRGSVVWLVLRESLVLIAVGIVVGLPLALAGTNVIKTFLFGVSAVDPVALAAALAAILVLALSAAYIPARRAAQIDPTRTLRHE